MDKGKMSEEKIIKECEELANNAYHELGNCWDEEYSREAICGLLDLYNKEKEKNSKYLEYQCRKCANRKVCKDNNWCVTMDRIPFICDNFENINYISKDKIREKIEELKDIESEYSKKVINEPTGTITGVVQRCFEELLEGE